MRCYFLLARVLSRKNHNRDLEVVSVSTILLALLLVFSSLPSSQPFRAYATIPGPYVPPQIEHFIDVNLTFGQILRIEVPSSSNVSILSLSGGQYDTGLYVSGSKQDLLFTPAQIANYTLVLNISSATPSSAGLSLLGSPTTTWTNNVTATGNFILNMTVIVLPQPVSQSSGWNPLFGFTGISLGGITLDTTDILAIFALFSISLMLIGIKRSQKLLYTGLFFLSLVGVVVVGILVVGIIFGSYLAGFLVIKSYFGFRSRRQNGL